MKHLLRNLYRRAVDAAHRGGTYRGQYRNFEEAAKDVPRIKPVGYDHAELATWYRHKLDGIGDDDYPALYWLSQAFQDARSVFEVGGHVGVAYHGFARYMEFPQELQWQILEVPAIAEAGRRLAAELSCTNLRFVTSCRESRGADVFFAAGSLQYIESPTVSEMLAGFETKPSYIIINKTPVWEGETFVTLQSIGFSCCPYLIRNRDGFVREIEDQGYQLRDSWRKVRSLAVRFRPGKRLGHYSGFYFVRKRPH